MTRAAAQAVISPLEDHLACPRGAGRLGAAPHTGAAGGAACGDLVRLAVRVEGDTVVEAGFDARGCAAARAAGSAAVELVDGAPLLEAARTTPGDIDSALGGLTPAARHAADLAADALHRALGAAAGDGAAALAPSERRTLVAMSGGVDSAVAAQLAIEAGDEVVGVTLELWADPAGDGTKSCCSPQAVTGARALAHGMGVPHLTLDLRSRFRDDVVADFVAGHEEGRTPNPCVRCNGLVRFDAMLALAASLGASRLATGHYARVTRDESGPLLGLGADDRKDQAYMLSRLDPEQLDCLRFPLGGLTKPEVRRRAESAGLPVAGRAESQDLCFLAGVGRERFLRRHAAAAGGHAVGPRTRGPGRIVDAAGTVLGAHEGQERFTVGQRRGIGVSRGEPLYVLEKHAASNTVTVGPRAALATRRVELREARLHRPASSVERVKLRYRSDPVDCRVEGGGPSGPRAALALSLAEPVHGVAPGQTACLLRGDAVVGWGTIAGHAGGTGVVPEAVAEDGADVA